MLSKTPRNSSLELLRILSMMMVVGLHYLNPTIGGGLNTSVTFNRIAAYGFESLCISSVNCFVLISGYFLVDSKSLKVSRAADIYLSMVFYNVLLYAIAIIIGEYTFSFTELYWAMFPFFAGRKWYIKAYIILLFFVPFINRLINTLDKKALQVLLVIQLLMFSIWPSFFPDAPITDRGYGITNFITLYIIAAYIKRYCVFGNKKKIRVVSLTVFCVSVIIITVSAVLPYLNKRAWDYCYIFVIAASVSLFLFFVNLKPIYNTRINDVAACTFGVYLSHASIYLQNTIYNTVMNVGAYRNTPWFSLHFVICVILQFFTFAFIEYIRLKGWSVTRDKLFKCIKLTNVEETINQKISEEKQPEEHGAIEDVNHEKTQDVPKGNP